MVGLGTYQHPGRTVGSILQTSKTRSSKINSVCKRDANFKEEWPQCWCQCMYLAWWWGESCLKTGHVPMWSGYIFALFGTCCILSASLFTPYRLVPAILTSNMSLQLTFLRRWIQQPSCVDQYEWSREQPRLFAGIQPAATTRTFMRTYK